MDFHLVLPGLAWPGRCPELPALPALAALLGHAKPSWHPASAPEHRLAELFGASGRLPHAALRRAGESDQPTSAAAHWLCCDPVHLHFSRDTLLLSDASSLAIRAAEAAELIAGLNETFADIGHFEAPAPERWYVTLAEQPKPQFYPLADVAGRPVQLFMPEGEDIARWARLANEIEVWLYNHPVNAAREAAGLRTINGVWLWGAGAPNIPLQAPAQRIQADDPLSRGLAQFAGVSAEPADHYRSGSAFAVVDSLRTPALHGDWEAWRSALARLETEWFAPLLADFKAKRLRRIVIDAPGDKHSLRADIAASGLWKFWTKPRPLADLLATAPPPAPAQP